MAYEPPLLQKWIHIIKVLENLKALVLTQIKTLMHWVFGQVTEFSFFSFQFKRGTLFHPELISSPDVVGFSFAKRSVGTESQNDTKASDVIEVIRDGHLEFTDSVREFIHCYKPSNTAPAFKATDWIRLLVMGTP